MDPWRVFEVPYSRMDPSRVNPTSTDATSRGDTTAMRDSRGQTAGNGASQRSAGHGMVHGMYSVPHTVIPQYQLSASAPSITPAPYGAALRSTFPAGQGAYRFSENDGTGDTVARYPQGQAAFPRSSLDTWSELSPYQGKMSTGGGALPQVAHGVYQAAPPAGGQGAIPDPRHSGAPALTDYRQTYTQALPRAHPPAYHNASSSATPEFLQSGLPPAGRPLGGGTDRTPCGLRGCRVGLDDVSPGGMKRHIRQFHSDAARDGRVVCTFVLDNGDICGRVLEEHSWPKHLAAVHIGSMARKCGHCPKVISRPDALKRHMDHCHPGL